MSYVKNLKSQFPIFVKTRYSYILIMKYEHAEYRQKPVDF